MNNKPYQTPHAIVGTFVLAMGAPILAPANEWQQPAREIYTVSGTNSSYSRFDKINFKYTTQNEQRIFAENLSKFYTELLGNQEPLGADFEAIWDANVDLLYET